MADARRFPELKPGDRILLVRVPESDLEQRERERRAGMPDAGWTVEVLERILRQDPVVTIDRVDEHGYPWFDYVLRDRAEPEEHSLAIMDDMSWELP